MGDWVEWAGGLVVWSGREAGGVESASEPQIGCLATRGGGGGGHVSIIRVRRQEYWAAAVLCLATFLSAKAGAALTASARDPDNANCCQRTTVNGRYEGTQGAVYTGLTWQACAKKCGTRRSVDCDFWTFADAGGGRCFMMRNRGKRHKAVVRGTNHVCGGGVVVVISVCVHVCACACVWWGCAVMDVATAEHFAPIIEASVRRTFTTCTCIAEKQVAPCTPQPPPPKRPCHCGRAVSTSHTNVPCTSPSTGIPAFPVGT